MPIVGDVLADRYRIESVLGAGGMASVYRATDLRLDRQVALKVLLPNLARDPSLAGRFDREARMLAAVAHPNVAAIFDVEPGDAQTGREPFYVMELCDGGSLADRIATEGALDPEELVPIVGAIADGLAELHRSGVLHRDVKPGNILFSGGRPKLADFGIAKSDGSAEATTLTAPGAMVGTLPYLAPELLGGGAPTAASDVYALGVTTFQGLTGRLPKPFDSIGRFVDARFRPAPTVSSVLPRLGPAFDAAVAATLAIEPATRSTPEGFAADLRAALAVFTSNAPAEARAVPPAAAEGAAAGSIDWPTLVLAPPAPSTTGTPAASAASAARPVKARRSAPAATAAAAARGPGASAVRSTGVVLIVAISLLLLTVVALSVLSGGGPPTGLASPGPSASELPSPSPEPTPQPTATLGPAAAALQALDRVSAAINQAKGGKDGLTGGDAHELETLAGDVGQALRAGNYAAARDAAGKLAERADKITKGLEPARRDALLRAIRDLQAAIPPD